MVNFLVLITIAVPLFIGGYAAVIVNKSQERKELQLKILQEENQKKILDQQNLEEREKAHEEATKNFEREKEIFANVKKRHYDGYYAKQEDLNKEFWARVNDCAYNMLPELKTLLSEEKRAFKTFEKEIEPALDKKYTKLISGIKMGRLHNCISQKDLYSLSDLEISATIHKKGAAKDEVPYHTTLSSCDCRDFKYNLVPACKHMLFLAYSLGILQFYRERHQAAFDEALKRSGKLEVYRNRSSLSTEKKNSYSKIRGSEYDM